MASIQEVDIKIESHIDTCALRYAGIEDQMRGVNARLKRIEGIMICGAGAVILLLVNLILKLNA